MFKAKIMVHKTNFGTWDSKTIIPLEACLKDSFISSVLSGLITVNHAWSLVEGDFNKPDNFRRYGEKSEVMNYKEAKVTILKVFVQRKEAKVHDLKTSRKVNMRLEHCLKLSIPF